jgi:hypothetical protein
MIPARGAAADVEESHVNFTARFFIGYFNRTLVSCWECRKGNLLSAAFWKRVEFIPLRIMSAFVLHKLGSARPHENVLFFPASPTR